MPALITHHIFGEETVSRLPEGIIRGEEELLAFLLGNQGPDPFFVRALTIPEQADRCHHLARRMHREHVGEAFAALRTFVTHLPEQDKNVGRAFVLGLLGHYALDSCAHPFVFAQQDEIIENAVGLDDAGHEVHAVIESDLDTWMLWTMRHLTVTEAPATDYLARTERVDRVAGALFSAVARQVFRIAISPDEFGAAVGNYQTLYRLIDPLESAKVRRVASLERIVRPHSMAQSMAHTAHPTDECASANLERRAWRDGDTGAVSHDSFPDLFFDATERWAELTEAFVTEASDDFFKTGFALDYNGRRVEA